MLTKYQTAFQDDALARLQKKKLFGDGLLAGSGSRVMVAATVLIRI